MVLNTRQMLINVESSNRFLPSYWVLISGFKVWARGRGRKGAEVKRQRSGGRSGGMPPSQSIKHLNKRQAKFRFPLLGI